MTRGLRPTTQQGPSAAAQGTWWSFWMLGFLVLIPGCRLATIAAHNASFEVCLYFDELREEIDNNRSAKAAWRDVLRDNPGQRYSVDYERGFKAGYAQALRTAAVLAAVVHPFQPTTAGDHTMGRRLAVRRFANGWRDSSMARPWPGPPEPRRRLTNSRRSGAPSIGWNGVRQPRISCRG